MIFVNRKVTVASSREPRSSGVDKTPAASTHHAIGGRHRAKALYFLRRTILPIDPRRNIAQHASLKDA
jgi:hypothetical protein